MDGSRQENNLHLCFHGDEAPCTRACPFGVDLRSFMEKMQRGRFDAALREYRNAVVFPDIVWRICPAPCQASCVRSGQDAPLSINLLERACIEHARSTDPLALNVPKKEYRVAVVGAGLSGLTCAMKFAPKKYEVTIFEKTGALGGGLSKHIPEEILLAEIHRQFGNEDYSLLLNTPVEDLGSLAFDAVYVSSGVDLPGEGRHIFRCPPDLSPVEMILDGTRSLYEIEWFLKTGNRRPPEPKAGQAARPNTLKAPDLAPMPAIQPENGESYSKTEAKAEAGRCLLCDCSACMDSCALLRKYHMYPSRLMEEVNLTMNPVTLFTGREALRQICSCSQCGLCKQVCPEGVDIGDYFLRTRRELQETGAFPPAFHDFWLRDMAFSNGPAKLLLKPEGWAGGGFVFFPGCQLGGSDPRYVTAVYEYLLRRLPGTALLLRCCGAPAIWAGDAGLYRAELAAIREAWLELGRPVFLLSCPSCHKMLRDNLPDVPCRMIYDEFDIPWESGPQRAAGGGAVSVFDPCAARGDPGLQKKIRMLAESMGYTLEELPYHGEEARCCSWGGQSFTAGHALAGSVVAHHITRNENPYIAYCINCRDIFSAAGKECFHILDLLFGINEGLRPPPTRTQHRGNRLSLKRTLAGSYGVGAETAKIAEGPPPATLLIDESLALRMSNALILEEDVRAVIMHCETTGQKLRDNAAGHTVGHLRIGIMTYWAAYEPQGGSRYRVVNAYCHRMMIEEEA